MKNRSSFFSLHSAIVIATLTATGGLVLTTAGVLAQGISDDDPEIAFNDHCRECHSADKGDNRLGPSLYGVVGRKAGSIPNFGYSEALKDSGITWTEKNLNAWITSPNSVVPGNNMGAIFSGLQDAKARAKIIAYLKGDTKKKPGKS
ncbi:MAG: c-type cytochrome [Proteobacteria bacterium]|nr:c-type cytochrome [Pseudomonadota bacterium]